MKFRPISVISIVCLVSPIAILTLPSCSVSPPEKLTSTSTRQTVAQSPALWSSQLENPDWKKQWNVKDKGSWGWENLEIMADESGKFSQIIRVHYPAGSASPRASRREGTPIGGSQFYADLGIEGQERLRLSYFVRFSENFDFVKGGKLPGLFGGTGASGGEIPDGTDGFSTRYMWRKAGEGELYAYLPTSEEFGTSIGRGSWQFRSGIWYHLEQVIILNEPTQNDGRLQVFVDGVKVIDEERLTFRTTEDLKIEGIFFSTFFGGGDSSWATPNDVYIDFADFSVRQN